MNAPSLSGPAAPDFDPAAATPLDLHEALSGPQAGLLRQQLDQHLAQVESGLLARSRQALRPEVQRDMAAALAALGAARQVLQRLNLSGPSALDSPLTNRRFFQPEPHHDHQQQRPVV